jgi:DNA-binding NarL/FixJ family response regulator
MRIILADDQTEVRSAMRLLLEQEPELVVVQEAIDTRDLFQQLRRTHPELLLLDWELPGLSSNQTISVLRSSFPCLKVIAMSGLPDARQAALSAGVDAFVSKGDPPEKLLLAVRSLLE